MASRSGKHAEAGRNGKETYYPETAFDRIHLAVRFLPLEFMLAVLFTKQKLGHISCKKMSRVHRLLRGAYRISMMGTWGQVWS